MDHIYAPDNQGAIDDWTDFSVSLVDEERELHHHSDEGTLLKATKLRQTPSSVWRDDLPEAQLKEEGHFISEFPEATGDPHTLLESLHPTASGLNAGTLGSSTGIGKDVKESTLDTTTKLKIRAEEGVEKVKDRIHDITDDIRKAKSDVASSMRIKEEKTKLKTESTLKKAEDKLRSTGENIKSDLNKLEDKAELNVEKLENKMKSTGESIKEKTESGVENIKEKFEETWENTKKTVNNVKKEVSNELQELNSKAKQELNELDKDLHTGVEKVKEKLSPQKDKPDITVIENARIVVEDWNKNKNQEQSLLDRLTAKLHIRKSAESPKSTTTTTTTTVNSIDLPPKESDASMLDMVGKEKQKIDMTTVVTNKQSGGPNPASHIPSQLRVDQKAIPNLKAVSPHGGYGQADKDYYGGNDNLHGTGNTNTSTGPQTRV